MSTLLRLGWRENAGRMTVAVAAYRAAAAGLDVRRAAGGDYLVEDGPAIRACAAALGLSLQAAKPAEGEGARPLSPPRVAVMAGEGGAYPYYAYYTHALVALGFPIRALSAAEVAAGALDAFDILFLPGGFAIWGLDRSEATTGVDAAVQRFLAEGGSAIASCGGAFYLSAGRPDWAPLLDAKPRYTHEYLQTGAGVVDLALDSEELGEGLPKRIEVPYYHGPAYVDAGSNAEPLARFETFVLPSRLFIDNPLKRDTFERAMAGRPAALMAEGSAGRAIVFSPHPEMGDLVRKYISLDGYVRDYLPLRGHRTMAETLAFYAPSDSPSFRLILNAIEMLRPAEGWRVGEAGKANLAPCAPTALPDLSEHLAEAICSLRRRVRQEEGDAAFLALFEAELSRLGELWSQLVARWEALSAPLELLAELNPELERLAREAAASFRQAPGMSLAAAMAMIELPIRLLECALRLVLADLALRDVQNVEAPPSEPQPRRFVVTPPNSAPSDASPPEDSSYAVPTLSGDPKR